VALIHGFTSSPTTMRPIGRFLADRGFCVRVPLLPGHGTHWRELAKTRYRDWRRAVVGALDELSGLCDHAFLVGLSMGGSLVLDVASERRDVSGVVAINAALLDREGLLARLAPFVARLIPAVPSSMAGLVKNDAAKPGVDERAYDWVPARAAESLLSALPRIRKQLRGMQAPALIAYSPQDRSVSPASSRAVPRLTDAPVTLLRLERSYHLATLDYDRDLLEQSILGFIERLSDSAVGRGAVES
jgi:carboxylesterase